MYMEIHKTYTYTHTVHLIKKFTFRNHGKPYLAYVSTIQVRITLEESTLMKVRRYVRNLTYVSTYGACTRALQQKGSMHFAIVV